MGINDYVQIGTKIKELRKSKNIKQKDLAAQLKIPISTLANYENNHREPTAEILESISNIFDTTPLQLIGYEYLDIKYPNNKMRDNVFNCFTRYLISLGYKVNSIETPIKTHISNFPIDKQAKMLEDFGSEFDSEGYITGFEHHIDFIKKTRKIEITDDEFVQLQNDIEELIEFKFNKLLKESQNK